MKEFEQPNDEAKLEALKYPNGYVYVIDKAFSGKEDVPPCAIFGAWKVDTQGIIEGPFIFNDNYIKTT